jgi:hypothetical protein
MKKSLAFLSLALVQCIALCAADAIRLEFDFAQSDHGFLAGFADYLQNGDPSFYQLTNSWQARPTNLGGSSALFTALYYSRLTVWINRADKPHLWLEPDRVPGSLRLIWNQGTLLNTTTLGSNWPAVNVTTRPHTLNTHTEPRRFWRVSQP